MTGGILGIVAMRLVVGQLMAMVERYPALVDGAFIIIAWVGLKLLLEFAHTEGWVGFEIPKTISLGLIAVIFVLSFLYAKRQGPVSTDTQADVEAKAVLTGREAGGE